ncbi:InlB B-repeat-containing protein [Candidatus Methanomassiliicoccus intestinalis]|uniref:InlB B-repeat-containing protein n=3 Tax=Candidatus Methanomassiliicoccus intestinalis TaxID=1406512 RepID=UPI0037DDA27D
MNHKRILGVLAALLFSLCILTPAIAADVDDCDNGPTLADKSLPDGTILSDDGKTLINASSAAVNYTIPDTVETVAGYAFFKCSSIKSITFQEGVKTIESHAFDGLGLITVNVPKNAPYMSSIPPFFNIVTVGGEPDVFTVSFNSNGGSSVASQSIEDGSTATKPADPAKSGYVFAGWYSNSSLTTIYNFNSAISANLTLYAKWVEELVFTSIPTADMIVHQNNLKSFTFTPKVQNASIVTWDFGDGNTLTASSTDPITHTYDTDGKYTVKLTASNNEGSAVSEKIVVAGEDNDQSLIDKMKDNPAITMIIAAIIAIIALVAWKVYR